MKKVLCEVITLIRNNKAFLLIVSIQLIIILGVYIISNAIIEEINRENEKKSDWFSYGVMDNLVGAAETDFFHNIDALYRLKILNAEYKNDDDYIYLEIYDNPCVLIGDNIGEKVLYRYEQGEGLLHRGEEGEETYNEVKSLWVNSNTLAYKNINCINGKGWQSDDRNDYCEIPILLGDEYSDIYKVGDTIEGITPLDGNTTFEVYGIIQKGELLDFQGRTVCLDRYVLLPLLDCKGWPESEEDLFQQKMRYLFKNSGEILSMKSLAEVQEFVSNCCIHSGVLPESYAWTFSETQTNVYSEKTAEIAKLLKSMSLIAFIIFIVSTIFYSPVFVDNNRSYFSTLQLVGFSHKEIIEIILGCFSLAYLLSAVIVFFVMVALLNVFTISIFDFIATLMLILFVYSILFISADIFVRRKSNIL